MNTGKATCGLLLLALAPGFAADARAQEDERVADDGQVLVLPAAALVSFQPLNARIEVDAGPGDSIRVEASQMGPVRLEAEMSGELLEIHERRPARASDVEAVYRLTLPRTTGLRLTLQVGDVVVRGLEGAVRVGVVDGSVTASSLEGSVQLSAVTGGVELRDASGTLSVRSVAGDIALRDVEGDLQARTTSGDVEIVTSAPVGVDAESYSGAVRFTGAIASGRPASFATHSGEISLDLDPATQPTLFPTSVRGSVDVDCPAASRGASGEGPVVVDEGGGASTDVVSFSGAIRIRCLP